VVLASPDFAERSRMQAPLTPATNKVEARIDLTPVHSGTIPRSDVAQLIVNELSERR
jgi:hypothetical protein